MTDPPNGGDPLVRCEAIVRGHVQGVGYRYYVLRHASALGLGGWVANERDGSVRCVAEGPRSLLERLVEALADGPPGGRVDRVEVSWSPSATGLTGFEVRSGSHPGD